MLNNKILKLFVLVIFTGLFSACKVTEKNITGTYYPRQSQLTRLILKEDKTFELALLNPAIDSLLLTHYPSQNFFTTGTWQLENKKLLLTSNSSANASYACITQDSISRFTTISSFNFWNRFGDPVSIRYIVLPPSKAKPHFGNSLFYFAQDFKVTDTLQFHFDGYPEFNFPGSIPPAIGNNMHKITFTEPCLPNVFKDISFAVKVNKLISPTGKVTFIKRK
jgi:hypothetical protein